MMEPNNSIEIPNKRYFTIGEVSNITKIKTHILRYWEKEFDALEPTKRTGNRRYYSSSENLSQDNQTLSLIKKDIQKIIDVLDK